MKNKITLFFLLLFVPLAFGQINSEKLIHGKITLESGIATGVTIVNLVNEKSTTTNDNGEFFILAKAGDLLVFSAVNLEYYRRQMEEEDLKPEVLILKMTTKTTQLQEVVIDKHSEINAVALGISPKGIKHRTQMERRLYTAGDFKPIHLLGLLGGSLDVDPILNAINGRTAMTKKLIELEKKRGLLENTANLFEEEFYVNTLKIPFDYIQGFQYYILDNEKFVSILKSKNKIKIEFEMIELAKTYNTIISSNQ